jgi:hypothetical protein
VWVSGTGKESEINHSCVEVVTEDVDFCHVP